MRFQTVNSSASSGPKTSRANARPGRSVLSKRQWLSLARALPLSERELEIVQCIFDDHTGPAMARQLGISVHTINTHMERLYRQLGVNTRSAAVVCVFAEHLNQHSPG